MTGHFTAPSAENVLLSMNGCEPHANNFGGSVLLTRQSGKWERTWYVAGALTNSCRKIALATKREILLCEGGYMGSERELAEAYEKGRRVGDLLVAALKRRALHASPTNAIRDARR